MDISGKVALITGGSSGIGLALAQELLENNIKGIAIIDINPPKENVPKDKVLFVETDVRDYDQLKEAFEKTVKTFKNLDIVFNNAGILDSSNWKKLYDVNLTGATNCMLLAMENYLPKYKSSEDAVIMNTCSVAGLAAFFPFPLYSASKYGLLGLVQAYSNEFYFKQYGVKLLVICPSSTDTRIFDDLENKNVGVFNSKEEVYKMFPPQPAKAVAERTLEIIKENVPNGSIYVIIDGNKSKIEYPEFKGIPQGLSTS